MNVSSLKNVAYREIGRRIISSELIPGEFVNRRALAANLGMSVAPVLEAILLLESEGLLETIPRKGTRVRIQRLEDVRGHFLVREALECQAARLVFGKSIAENFPRLAKLARDVDKARRENKLNIWEAEVAFHCAIVDLIGAPAFTEAFRKSLRTDLFYKLRYVISADVPKRRGHLRLLKALRDAPDARTAAKICRRDLRHGRAALFMRTERDKPLAT